MLADPLPSPVGCAWMGAGLRSYRLYLRLWFEPNNIRNLNLWQLPNRPPQCSQMSRSRVLKCMQRHPGCGLPSRCSPCLSSRMSLRLRCKRDHPKVISSRCHSKTPSTARAPCAGRMTFACLQSAFKINRIKRLEKREAPVLPSQAAPGLIAQIVSARSSFSLPVASTIHWQRLRRRT
jgi:hypothetical protein